MKFFFEYLWKNWGGLYSGFILNQIISDGFLIQSRYRPNEIIGVGGTSIVISANDLILNREVALKFWNPNTGLLQTQHDNSNNKSSLIKALDYFKKEAQLIASLKHPNICQIYDFFTYEQVPFLAMELCQGKTLRNLLHSWATNPTLHIKNRILHLFKQIVIGVCYLHYNGFYQLDIKPENIIVEENLIKIIDFASFLSNRFPQSQNKAIKCGTPGYAAPDLFQSHLKINPSTDIFSLGVIFLEMFYLYNPIASYDWRKKVYHELSQTKTETFLNDCTACWVPNESDKEMIMADWREVFHNEISIFLDYFQVDTTIPQEYKDLVTRMISVSPTNRPKDGGEVLRELTQIEFSQKNQASLNKKNANNKITVLFLSSDPTNASRLRLGEEIREIREKLQLSKLHSKFLLESRFSVRPQDISQALLEVNPEIVHFSGHGSTTGEICVENQNGTIHPIKTEALADLFRILSNDVQCVILNACYSDAQAKAISSHVNFVIGMSHEISDKAAIAFAIGFYQGLGNEKNIIDSYHLGCTQIQLQNLPDFQIPVLQISESKY